MTSSASRRSAAALGAMAVLAAGAMIWGAGAPPLASVAALLAVLAFGYVPGALLFERCRADAALSTAVVRTVAGLLLSTVAFLLSLVLSVPWFTGPAVVTIAALARHRGRAVALPRPSVAVGWDGAVAAALVAMIVSPIVITVFSMAPGAFPPVFYNIDTAYHLEKVHALAGSPAFPPESLSNLGIRRTYHYGSQAMGALVSRATGLLPHQAMFLIVLPLLTAGVVAAAAAAARYAAPAVPRSVAVPLLLVSTPSLSNPFWDDFVRQLGEAARDGLSLDRVIGDYSLWGILSNEGPNVGGDFVIVAAIAAIAAVPHWGWRMAAFLVGSAVLVKTTVGIALVAGFGLVEAWRALAERRLEPSRQALMAGSVLAVVLVAFFLHSFESNFRIDLYPFFHLKEMVWRGHTAGLLADVVWLLLPVAIVLSARVRGAGASSTPFLLLAVAPLVVVNTTRLENVSSGGAGSGDDWFQSLHAVPFLLHAFALALASRRWHVLGRVRRAAFMASLILVVAPVSLAAAHYSARVLREPAEGNDFVDNRPLAEALATIPIKGTVIVTNDLRYPAGYFTRNDRQMQVPALFGHQAFAVNYAHEAVEERRSLQALLQQTAWTADILTAAREHGWTHLLIRKDYPHPAPMPLERVFDGQIYAVFRFP